VITPVVAVLLVLALIVIVVLTTVGGSTTLSTSGSDDHALTRREFASIAIGDSRGRIEDLFGKGARALDYLGFGATGAALEPLDASCVYYADRSIHYSRAFVLQLCFSHDKLVSKRRSPEALN
jgi:hypothetical protein